VKKHNAFLGTAKQSNTRYILTRPTRLSDMSLDEIEDADAENGWREKSRQLQARRWRKIRHELA
jgi:hypothetical protein